MQFNLAISSDAYQVDGAQVRDGREGVAGQRADPRVVGEPQLPDPDVALEGPGQQGPEERVKFNQGIIEAMSQI